jgi:hypothetical protein
VSSGCITLTLAVRTSHGALPYRDAVSPAVLARPKNPNFLQPSRMNS